MISRESFPKGFTFGTASSAFQYEGAVKEDGRGATVWDTFSHQFGKIIDMSNADVAVDQYHLYNEDVQLMKDMGMDAYRFSIAWSRIFPNGSGEINQAGVDHYNNLIDALLAKGIEPYITLFHWDLPQALEDQYKGWLDPQIIMDFANYAETCFQKFGDRVKHWITFNEPHTLAIQGYDVGIHAPGRGSILLHLSGRAGNSATEPYIFAHNMLLSHATVADIYRKKYKSKQGGQVGVAFDVIWFEPGTNSTDDIEAAQRAQDFQLGWFIEPLIFGTYPTSMVSRVGDRLPKFSESESALLKNSLDFVGINHYTTFYAYKNSTGIIGALFHDTLADSGAITLPFKGFTAIGDRASSIWLYIVPTGMRSLMNYIRTKYGNPPVIITENGCPQGRKEDQVPQRLPDEPSCRHQGGWVQCEGVLCVVIVGQLGMDGWVHIKIWSLLCGLQGQAQEIPKGLCSMVQEIPYSLEHPNLADPPNHQTISHTRTQERDDVYKNNN